MPSTVLVPNGFDVYVVKWKDVAVGCKDGFSHWIAVCCRFISHRRRQCVECSEQCFAAEKESRPQISLQHCCRLWTLCCWLNVQICVQCV